MKKIKIAFVLDNMIYGGIERVAINYLKGLSPEKYDIDVFILNPNVEEIIKEIPDHFKVIIWNVPRMLCTKAYYGLIAKKKYGVLYFILGVILTTLILPFLMLRSLKFGKYDVGIAFSGHFNDLLVVSKLLRVKKRIAWIHGALYQYVLLNIGYGKIYNKFDKKIVLSKIGEEEIQEYNPHIKVDTEKLWNPIPIYKNQYYDIEKIAELKEIYGEYVLMVGRIAKPKDYKTVIEASTILKEEFGLKLNFVFLGDGPDIGEYSEYVKVNKLENIHFLGNKEDVQNYYKSAKVLVHSSFYEGLPTVLLEAMAVGLPIISTDSPVGVREILGDSKYGIVCSIRDARGMAKQIVRLYSDEQLYDHYINIGKERIKHFQPEVIIPKLEKIIDNLTDSDIL